MAKIVHQTSHCDIAHIVIRYVVVLEVLGETFVLFADFFQTHHLFLSQMTDAQTVRKTSMCRTWKHIVQAAELVEAL